MINLEIDYREKALIKVLDDKNIDYKAVNLELGDIRFLDSSLNELIVFERKTLKDLASSIKDGRYHEQSMRLDSHRLHNHNIIYLIEGDMDYYRPPPIQNPVTKDALYSSMFSILYFKGFSVIKTKNLNETFEIIFRFYNKLLKDKKESYYYKSQEDSKDYTTTIKTTKKDNITLENIDVIMLTQIPSVSLAIASRIMEEYNSLGCLLDALRKDPNSLDGLMVETATGKQRKMSKPAIANIIKYLKIEKV
tara:strand:+ start:1559 stop:2308 length:750 start_codon:yes stop_codon:yes gene_type:complete